jgi:DNA replication protein DnaC
MNMLRDRLLAMRLYGMAGALEEYADSGAFKEMEFEEKLGILLEQESIERQNRQLKRLITMAKLRYKDACIEEIKFDMARGFDKGLLVDLSKMDWVRNKRNIIITGATGTGKTYIASAIGNSACRHGIKTLYVRLHKLISELNISRATGEYIKTIDRISKVELLIIDDWGMSSLNDSTRRDLLEIVENRYNIHSTIIATQFPVDKWHSLIGDPTFADAICDRLIHNAYKIRLAGESMRKMDMEHKMTGSV